MSVVVTYQYPIAGTTTAPTAAQVVNLSMVTAAVSMADSDTTGTVTHNFGLSLAEGTNLFPIVVTTVASAGTLIPALSVVNTNSIAVAINKLSAAGSGGTYNVYVMRPWSGMK